jgi:hypothetical protein
MSLSLDVQAEIERCREVVAQLQVSFETVKAELAREQERLNLLERLRVLDDTPSEQPLSASQRPVLEDAVVDYLRLSGKPMHISVIRSNLIKDGVPIPGKGVDANVITRISRDGRIARAPGRRGYYVLSRA